MNTAEVVGMIAPILVLIGVLMLIGPIVMGMLCKRLAYHKGYKGYFWMGFFLGILGFAYVFALPDKKMQMYMRVIAKGNPAALDTEGRTAE